MNDGEMSFLEMILLVGLGHDGRCSICLMERNVECTDEGVGQEYFYPFVSIWWM